MTPIDHAAIYDFANERLKQTDIDMSKSLIKALAEDIFNTYFKENFNSQTINLQGHLRSVVDNRPMADFENQRLWRDLKDRYLSVIESYLLDPMVKGVHKKKKSCHFSKKVKIILTG